MDALGGKFLIAFAASVTGARSDIKAMRDWEPSWFPTMHSRCLSNIIHDRIWARLVAGIESDPSAEAIEYGPTREIAVGQTFRLRIKRHRIGDKISTYPTLTALGFWKQDNEQPSLDGFEEIRLAVGYRWNPDEREIEAPVLSFRDGKDNVIWAVELDEPTAGAKTVNWKPVQDPSLPTLDFGDLGDESGVSGGQ